MTNTASHTAAPATADRSARRSTETKAATKTTELITYLAVVAAIVITATLVGDGDHENGMDLFDARQAIEYITYLTIGYLVARGLAKSCSREHHTA